MKSLGIQRREMQSGGEPDLGAADLRAGDSPWGGGPGSTSSVRWSWRRRAVEEPAASGGGGAGAVGPNRRRPSRGGPASLDLRAAGAASGRDRRTAGGGEDGAASGVRRASEMEGRRQDPLT